MKSISAVIIAKNAEETIRNCLESVKFCTEIIVIDNNSSDKTVVIAKEKGAKIYIEDSNDFSKKRNLGLQKAKNDWILYIDTDEVVSEKLRKEIISAIQNTSYAAYKIPRQNFYLGKHPWPFIEKLERLFKKTSIQKWTGKLHESPVVTGTIDELREVLSHYTHRTLSSMLQKTIEWSKIEAELRFYNNHPQVVWWRFPRVMIAAFFSSYIKQAGWRVGTVGIIESIYQAFSIFITYARLWELQKNKKQ